MGEAGALKRGQKMPCLVILSLSVMPGKTRTPRRLSVCRPPVGARCRCGAVFRLPIFPNGRSDARESCRSAEPPAIGRPSQALATCGRCVLPHGSLLQIIFTSTSYNVVITYCHDASVVIFEDCLSKRRRRRNGQGSRRRRNGLPIDWTIPV